MSLHCKFIRHVHIDGHNERRIRHFTDSPTIVSEFHGSLLHVSYGVLLYMYSVSQKVEHNKHFLDLYLIMTSADMYVSKEPALFTYNNQMD